MISSGNHIDKIIKQYNSLSLQSRAAIWFVICNILVKGFNFFSAPIFASLLSSDQYGIVSVYNAYQQILVIFATLELYLAAYNKQPSTFTNSLSQYKWHAHSLKFVDYVNLTGSAINWDLSENKDNSIIGWATTNSLNSSAYDVFIGSNFSIYAKNLSNMFNSFSEVAEFNIDLLHTSEATDMSNMFRTVAENPINNSDFNLHLGTNFDVSNVTNMSYMFFETGLRSDSVNITFHDDFNASKVTNMSWMFYGVGLQSNNVTINLGNNFNACNVLDMSVAFHLVGADKANYFDLNLGNNFNASNVTNMHSMFANIGHGKRSDYANTAIANININLGNNFNASSATDMNSFMIGAGYSANIVNINLGNNFNVSSLSTGLAYGLFNEIGEDSVHVDINFGNNFNISNESLRYTN